MPHATMTKERLNTVREEMRKHRAVIAEYERQAAGIDQDPRRGNPCDAALGVYVALAISSLLWIAGILVYQWMRS